MRVLILLGFPPKAWNSLCLHQAPLQFGPPEHASNLITSATGLVRYLYLGLYTGEHLTIPGKPVCRSIIHHDLPKRPAALHLHPGATDRTV